MSLDNQTGSTFGDDGALANFGKYIFTNRFKELVGLIVLFKKHEINFMDETAEYRISVRNINNQQRHKTNLWVDILTLLMARKAAYSK